MRVRNCILARPMGAVSFHTPSLSLLQPSAQGALIVLWKLAFRPSLNTASRTYFSNKSYFSSMVVSSVPLPHANSSRRCYRGLGAMYTAPLKHHSQALKHISTCLHDIFLWCKPHLKLHFTLPKLYTLLPQQCYLLGLQEPCICLHQLPHLEKHLRWLVLHLTITPSFTRCSYGENV